MSRSTGCAACLTAQAGGLIVLMLVLSSCIDLGGLVQARFDSLEPGIPVAQVSRAVGTPDRVVGELTTAYGQYVVVWEYDKITYRFLFLTQHTYYWIYLADGHFVKMTRRGDWQGEKNSLFHAEYPRYRD